MTCAKPNKAQSIMYKLYKYNIYMYIYIYICALYTIMDKSFGPMYDPLPVGTKLSKAGGVKHIC